jgi:hypothetical protein
MLTSDPKKTPAEVLLAQAFGAAKPPVMPPSESNERMRAPGGLFRIGFIAGLILLWTANSTGLLPVWAERVLFPQPVINFGMKAFFSAWQTLCAGWCDGLYDVNKLAAIWLYVIVGFYFGLLVWVLGHFYVFAKNRSQW